MDNELETQKKILIELIGRHKSLREFSRIISEDPSDIMRWRDMKLRIHTRAALTICKMFHIEPQLLRPDLFGTDMKITFEKNNKEKK